jgi:hypothetical protein
MSVYHCPLCPLIFQFRTEVEWHLRQEHRSRTDEEADLQLELAGASRRLDEDALEELRSSTGGTAVSLLIATTPASTMTGLDVARLRQLADRATRRLSAEPHTASAAPVIQHRLARAVAAAEARPTDRGLAIFIDHLQLAMFSLPFSPRDRAVVDPTFATRDVEYALARHPSTRVIVLGRRPRVLEGRPGQWSEFDLSVIDAPRGQPGETVQPGLDRLIEQRVRTSGSLPLIVIGSRRQRNSFRRAHAIAAECNRGWTRTASAESLAEEAMDRWNRDQQNLSVASLRRADAMEQVTWGLVPTWRAISQGTAERLWVEHDFARSGHIVAGPDGVEVTSDPAEPGAIDDLVDALITTAHRRGIPVDLLDSGTLPHPEAIAARVRTAGRPPPPHPAGTTDTPPPDDTMSSGARLGTPVLTQRHG